MGQEEVLKYLSKQSKPLSSSQIADGLGIGKDKACVILGKLVDQGEVYATEIDRHKASKILNYKVTRKLRLFRTL